MPEEAKSTIGYIRNSYSFLSSSVSLICRLSCVYFRCVLLCAQRNYRRNAVVMFVQDIFVVVVVTVCLLPHLGRSDDCKQASHKCIIYISVDVTRKVYIHLYSSNQIDGKQTRKHIHTNIRNSNEQL